MLVSFLWKVFLQTCSGHTAQLEQRGADFGRIEPERAPGSARSDGTTGSRGQMLSTSLVLETSPI